MKLVGGPVDGRELDGVTASRVVVPVLRSPDTLAEAVYDNGVFVEERVITTTWTADQYRRTVGWLWRDTES